MFFFSSRRRHTRCSRDWSSDVCSSDLSPAAKAGIQRGDVLVEFDGKRLEGPVDLQRAVGLLSPGQSAKMKVWRDQSEKTVEIKVSEAPDEREARERPAGRPRSLLGLEVRPITPELAQRFNLKSTEGVLVARVEEGSAAAEAGI